MYQPRQKVAYRMIEYVYMLLSDTTCGLCNKMLNYIEKEAWLLIARGRASSLKDKQAVYLSAPNCCRPDCSTAIQTENHQLLYKPTQNLTSTPEMQRRRLQIKSLHKAFFIFYFISDVHRCVRTATLQTIFLRKIFVQCLRRVRIREYYNMQ
jgi:hypothetical protein